MCKAVVLCLIALSPIRTSAQIVDLITDYVAGCVSDYVADKLDSYLHDSWNEMISQGAQDAIVNKAYELRDFNIDKSKLSYLLNSSRHSSNGDINIKALFQQIPSSIETEFYKSTHTKSNVPFSFLGKGFIGEPGREYIDSIKSGFFINELEDVLSQSVLDSLSCFGGEDLKNEIKRNIQENRRLLLLFNNHPSAVRIYANSQKTVLHKDARHLLYWATCADSIYGKLSKSNRKKFVNASEVRFENDRLLYEGNTLARCRDGKTFVVDDVMMLNFYPKGDSEYRITGKTAYRTDVFGRVVEIDFLLSRGEKNEKVKNPIKFKHVCKAMGVKPGKELYTYLLEKYRIAPSLAFAVPMDVDDAVKKNIQIFHKALKKKLKKENWLKVGIVIEYDRSVSRTPSSITVKFGNETMCLY